MRVGRIMLIAGFALACWLPSPARCEQKGTYAIGVGWSGATINVDVARAGEKQITADGWGLAGRIGLSKRWGLEFSYRTLRDDENFATGEEISLDLIGGHAYVTWLETEHSHWYAKMGLSWVDFEDEIPKLTADHPYPVVVVNTRTNQSIVVRTIQKVATGYVTLKGFSHDQAGSFTTLSGEIGGAQISYTVPYAEITGVVVSGSTEELGNQIGFQTAG